MPSPSPVAAIQALLAGEHAAADAGGQEQALAAQLPRDQAAHLARLRSFAAAGPAAWFGKPQALSPETCAASGWRLCAPDTLQCDACSRKVIARLPANALSEPGASIAHALAARLSDAHEASCPHRKQPSRAQLRFPLLPPARLAAGFDVRLCALQQLRVWPRVQASVVQQLSTAAADLAPGLAASVAAVLQAPSGADSSSEAQALSLPREQALAVVALCGWQVQQLLPPSGTGESPSIGPSATALACELCASKVGLWSLAGAGPFCGKTLGAKAAGLHAALGGSSGQAAAEPAEPPGVAPAAGRASPAVLTPAAPAATTAAAAPPSSSQQEQQQQRGRSTASPEVASVLGATIAGGLLSPPGSAGSSLGGGPFGAQAPLQPVFGSTSGAGMLGRPHAAPPPGLVAGAPGATAAPEPAFGSSQLPGGVFGISALRHEEQRVKRRRSGSAAPAGGAGAEAAGPSDSQPAQQPGLPQARASGGAFDPLSSHRLWCPWVSGSSGSGGGIAAALCVGWAATLLALQGRVEAQQLAGGPEEPGGGIGSGSELAGLPRAGQFDSTAKVLAKARAVIESLE